MLQVPPVRPWQKLLRMCALGVVPVQQPKLLLQQQLEVCVLMVLQWVSYVLLCVSDVSR